MCYAATLAGTAHFNFFIKKKKKKESAHCTSLWNIGGFNKINISETIKFDPYVANVNKRRPLYFLSNGDKG